MNVNSIALSGLHAAQTRLDSAAHNVANADTPGFRRQVVQAEPQAEGGVSTRVDKRPEPGVDLAEEMVEQMSATIAYKANLQMVKAQDRMMGSLLDTQG